MWGALEDRPGLRPADERALLGVRDVIRGGEGSAERAREAHGPVALRGADDSGGSGGATDKARVLFQELLEPGVSVLLHAARAC